MARKYSSDSKNTWGFGYDCAIDHPMDTKWAIETDADRLDPETWKIGSAYYHYNCMPTISGEGHLWIYIGENGNTTQVADEDYWVQIGSVDTSKFVTLDTEQTITANKTYSKNVIVGTSNTADSSVTGSLVAGQYNSAKAVNSLVSGVDVEALGDRALIFGTQIPYVYLTTVEGQTNTYLLYYGAKGTGYNEYIQDIPTASFVGATIRATTTLSDLAKIVSCTYDTSTKVYTIVTDTSVEVTSEKQQFNISNTCAGRGVFIGGGNCSNTYVTALGWYNQISAKYSSVLGYLNGVGGQHNHVLGGYNYVSAQNLYATVLGSHNVIKFDGGTVTSYTPTSVIGTHNTVEAHSYILGRHNNINEESTGSLAIGSYNSISGYSSKVFGNWLLTKNTSEIAIGYGNLSTKADDVTSTLGTKFTIGNGTGSLSSVTTRKNLLEVRTDDKWWLKGIGGYDGTNAYSEGVKDLATILASAGGECNLHKSTAGGYYTDTNTASASKAFAIGDGTQALGTGSFASGEYTTANNNNETALGQYNKSTAGTASLAGTIFSVGVGADEESPVNAFEINNSGELYIKGVGGYTGDNYGTSGVSDVATYINSLYSGIIYDSSLTAWRTLNAYTPSSSYTQGENSIAFGYSAKASGNYSTAIGIAAEASGTNAIALTGTALSVSSIALGSSIVEADAPCAAAIASGRVKTGASYAVAIGYDTAVSGKYSYAMGRGLKTSSENEVALGVYNYDESSPLFSIGCGTADNNRRNILEIGDDYALYTRGIGGYTGANRGESNIYSIKDAGIFFTGGSTGGWKSVKASSASNDGWAFGSGCSATAYNAAAFGGGNTVSGQNSAAFGASSTVSGDYCFSMGQSNVLQGTSSYAFGAGNYGYSGAGGFSFEFGTSNKAYGGIIAMFGSNNESKSGLSSCFVSGYNCKIYGNYNFAGGFNTYVGYDGTTSENSSSSFAYGQGLSNFGNQSAAFGLSNSISTHSQYGCFVTGRANKLADSGTTGCSYSTVIGYNNTVTADTGSFTEGYMNKLLGATGCHMEGYANYLTDGGYQYCHIEGSNNSITGGLSYAHVEGTNSKVKANYGHAEGNGTTVDYVGGHAEGTYNYPMQALSYVGTGNSSMLRNAVAVMPDGKVYVYGVGSYTGQAIGSAKDLATAISEAGGTSEEFITHSSATLEIDLSTITKPTYYDCGTLTTLNIAHSAIQHEVTIHFTAGTGFAKTFTPTSFKVLGLASEFEIVEGKEYELSIKNNIFALSNIETAS